MLQLIKVAYEGLTGISSQPSALKSDVDNVAKKLEKQKFKKKVQHFIPITMY